MEKQLPLSTGESPNLQAAHQGVPTPACRILLRQLQIGTEFSPTPPEWHQSPRCTLRWVWICLASISQPHTLPQTLYPFRRRCSMSHEPALIGIRIPGPLPSTSGWYTMYYFLYYFQEVEGGNTNTDPGACEISATDAGSEEAQGSEEKAPARFGWVVGVMVSKTSGSLHPLVL